MSAENVGPMISPKESQLNEMIGDRQPGNNNMKYDPLVHTELRNILPGAETNYVTGGLEGYYANELLKDTTIKRALCLHQELNWGYVPVKIPIPLSLIPEKDGGTSECEEWFKIPTVAKLKIDVEFPDKTYSGLTHTDIISDNIQFMAIGSYVKIKGRNDWGKIKKLIPFKQGDTVSCEFPYTYIVPSTTGGSGIPGEAIRFKAPIMKKYGYFEKWVRVPLELQEKANKQLVDMGAGCNRFYDFFCTNQNQNYNDQLKRNNETFSPEKYWNYESDCGCMNYNTSEGGTQRAQKLIDASQTKPKHCWMVGCNSMSVRTEFTKSIKTCVDCPEKKIYKSYIPSDMRKTYTGVNSAGQLVMENASNAISTENCGTSTVCTVNNIIANNDFAGDVGIEASMDVNCGGKDNVKRPPESCTMGWDEGQWGKCACNKQPAPYLYRRMYDHMNAGGPFVYYQRKLPGDDPFSTPTTTDPENCLIGRDGKCKKIPKMINNGWGTKSKWYSVKYPPYKAACPSTGFRKMREMEGEAYDSFNHEWIYIKEPDNKVYHIIDCGNQTCNVDANVGPWGNWGRCSFKCDGGYQARKRRVITEEYGKDAQELPPVDENGMDMEVKYSTDGEHAFQVQWRKCNPQACVCKHKTFWEGKWTECSEPCDGGEQYRWTSVMRPVPLDDTNCPFEDDLGNELIWTITETEAYVENVRSCNNHSCDAECEMGAWSKWSECKPNQPGAYCGMGKKFSTRRVAKMGINCGSPYREKVCSLKPCPPPPLKELKIPEAEKIDHLQKFKEQQELQLLKLKPIEDEEDDKPLFGGLALVFVLCCIIIAVMMMYG
jgi:hypothetical protein